ncbi:phage Mu protein F like protein (pseudogene) [Staphylococcus lugdunensis]|uniref:Bacterial toxin 50 domain-containing protein n=1 Tax=Staphylococcus lugdunensis TaxID=28035 RepID=A0ABD4EH85_STALU|nr:phage capsid protein [Staphylococcus lugdunensis]EFU84606.1 hypothetical protein HMPREF0790_0732 [Staphylococcus lugdunensis M23590]OFJ65799.1 phage capsid protein [Staphylococcus sp. HMSC077E11]OFM43647.1 phage capsid protein [Staphylococcus sp. HMSC077E12]OFR90886.1 phage capsid protein [Staphylococcus sp. HMSC059F04]OHQ49366.1 phage capsid protein [Staphylococcus sp. HMSC070D07]
MVPGINAPPMHPWCRSTTVPNVGNWRDQFFKESKSKYKVEDKEKHTSQYEKSQDKAKKEMIQMINDGRIKVELNVEKQNRHSLNNKLYLENKKFALKNNEKLPSYTILSNNELNRLLKISSTTGKILVNKGGFSRKEIIDFEKIIGKAFVEGKYIETSFGKVHYSKTGSHIVPFISKEN